MAKELVFKLNGAEYSSAPVKLERKKIYGWSSVVATNREGEVCDKAYLLAERSLLIPSGGYKQGMTDTDGRWLDKADLIAFDENGNPLQSYESSFDAPIELIETVSEDAFLDNDWESVYHLLNPELSEIVGEAIYTFDFSYRGGTNHTTAYLLNTGEGLFLFTGYPQEFQLVSLSDETVIYDLEEEIEDDIDELDFSMF